MRVPPVMVKVHRLNKWIGLMSDELYPGDVVLLQRNK